MQDLRLDREIAEMGSQEYFDELALDDELIRLREKRRAEERQADHWDAAFKELWEVIKDEERGKVNVSDLG